MQLMDRWVDKIHGKSTYALTRHCWLRGAGDTAEASPVTGWGSYLFYLIGSEIKAGQRKQTRKLKLTHRVKMFYLPWMILTEIMVLTS